MRTTVVKVRAFARKEFEADPDFLYVGHACFGWPKSDWANPFDWKVLGREQAVAKFETWLLTTLEGLSRFPHLGELGGKRLGCWCCDWDGTGEPEKACHAVVLARLVPGGGPK
jgi:hypothetical protein